MSDKSIEISDFDDSSADSRNLSTEQRTQQRSPARDPPASSQTTDHRQRSPARDPPASSQTTDHKQRSPAKDTPAGALPTRVSPRRPPPSDSSGSYQSTDSSFKLSEYSSRSSDDSSYLLPPELERQRIAQERSSSESSESDHQYSSQAGGHNLPPDQERYHTSQIAGPSGGFQADIDSSAELSGFGAIGGVSDFRSPQLQYHTSQVSSSSRGFKPQLDASAELPDFDASYDASDFQSPQQRSQQRVQMGGVSRSFKQQFDSSVEPSEYDMSSGASDYRTPQQKGPAKIAGSYKKKMASAVEAEDDYGSAASEYASPAQGFQSPADQQVLQKKKKPFYKKVKSKATGFLQSVFQPGASTSTRPSEAEAEAERYNFVIDYDPLYIVMAQPLQAQTAYIVENYKKICSYEFLAANVAEILNEFGPKGTCVDPYGNPGNILQEMRRILESAQKKWALFDISMKDLGLLKSSKISAKILSSKDRISEVLEAAYDRAYRAEQGYEGILYEKLDLERETAYLQAELEIATDLLERGGKPVDLAPHDLAEFIRDFKLQLTFQEHLNSSLDKQVQKERQRNHELYTCVTHLEQSMVEEQESIMESFTEAAQELEVKEGLKRAIISKIEGITSNKDEVTKGVKDWMRTTNTVLEEKQQAIQELEEQVRALENALVQRQVEVTQLQEKVEETTSHANTLKEYNRDQEKRVKNWFKALKLTHKAQEEYEKQILDQTRMTDSMQEEYYSMASATATPKDSSLRSPRTIPKPVVRMQSPALHRWPAAKKHAGVEDQLPFYKMDSIPESEDSPEQPRRGSPDYMPRYPYESDPMSFESTPSSRAPSHSSSAPSPYDLPVFSPDLPSYSGAAPGTQTLSRPRSPYDPAARTSSTVMNRIDVGDAFNMRTVHDASTPYSQLTRVASLIPEAGPSRMSDSPFHVKQRAELTPDQYVSPLIPKSRFGYTDPTCRALNIPPGPQFAPPSGINKTLVLTSPRSQEPLLVNIGVDPKPLVEGPTGEHFVCDISMDLQKAGGHQQYSPPIHTYDEPPDVTPTDARKYGLFTPRGIFKKDHFNIRRIHWPDEYQSPNLPWSPHDLSDARTPISSLAPSPYISDSSVPWESPESSLGLRAPGLGATFEASPQAALGRTFDKSMSPAIKGPRYARTSPETDTDESASFGIRTPGLSFKAEASPRAALGRTFDKSPSPVIKGPRYGMGSPETDTDESASFGIRTPGLSFKAEASSRAALGRTFDKSPSPVIRGLRYGMRSPETDTDESASFGMESIDWDRVPAVGAKFGASGSQRGQSDRTSSYEFDETFDSHGSPEGEYESHTLSPINRKYAKTSTPKSGFSGSSGSDRLTAPSFQSDSSQSRSASSQHSKSMSPKVNATFSKGQSPQSNETYDYDEEEEEEEEEEDRSTSRMNRTFNMYM